MTDLGRRCVLPFYLKMMGLNALRDDVPFGTLRQVAQQTADDDVAGLLASGWQQRVMGAWLAPGRIQFPGAALLRSLETSQGATDGTAAGDRRPARPGRRGRALAQDLPAARY